MERQLEHGEHQYPQGVLPLCLLLDNLTSPANVGSLFRLADAFAVQKIYLTGKTPAPPNRKLSKAARSTEKVVAYEHEVDTISQLQHLKAAGYTLICLEITTHSRALKQVSYPEYAPVCLIAGAERQGIQPEILALSDETVHIPMLGKNSSMNVANAAAIALFEITTQLQGNGSILPGPAL